MRIHHGLVYAFTTVATQAVVRPERAGEAAGVALTSLVTLAGVGVAVSGTMLEVLRHAGMSAGRGINSSSWPSRRRCCPQARWCCWSRGHAPLRFPPIHLGHRRSNVPDVATMKIARVPAANAKFELADVEIPDPSPGHVRVKVHACGVCHSDSLTVKGGLGNSFPRAPGHEVAGVVDAVGEGVSTWNVGDRVGVGWFGGCDFTCEPCRRGDFISCENGQIPGIAYDGGYAEYMVAPAEALARIPDDLSDVDAAPLMCAGITTFNALRESVARPGDVVAILGSADSATSASNSRPRWASRSSPSRAARKRGRLRKSLARITTSTPEPPTSPQN